MRDALDLLGDKRSPRRRAGAKKLRKLADPSAGPALLDALRVEVQDPRTWETQYQMIMALGSSGYAEALPFLRELAGADFEATMVYVALGDAIVRLARKDGNDARPVFECYRSGNDMLADGAFRAMAMLRMVPGDDAIEEIIDFVSARPREDPVRFWVVAAAPGWKGRKVQAFLRDCAASARDDIRIAAIDALEGKYRKWKPL